MRYRGTSEPLDDLLQVAHLGLIGAVERFEPGRGLRFRRSPLEIGNGQYASSLDAPAVADTPTPTVLADTLAN